VTSGRSDGGQVPRRDRRRGAGRQHDVLCDIGAVVADHLRRGDNLDHLLVNVYDGAAFSGPKAFDIDIV
jgi:hypothetical protein